MSEVNQKYMNLDSGRELKFCQWPSAKTPRNISVTEQNWVEWFETVREYHKWWGPRSTSEMMGLEKTFYRTLACVSWFWWKVLTLLGFLAGSALKEFAAMQETQVRSLSQEDSLEKGMTTHSSILVWEIPWMEEPGGLQSMGSYRVRHDWVTNTYLLSHLEVLTWSLIFSWLFSCLFNWMVSTLREKVDLFHLLSSLQFICCPGLSTWVLVMRQ